jgi:hypothetical protein
MYFQEVFIALQNKKNSSLGSASTFNRCYHMGIRSAF